MPPNLELTPVALEQFEITLKAAAAEFAENGRGGCETFLQSVIALLESEPQLARHATPCVLLLAALKDLNVGNQSALLQPVLFGNRPPEDTVRLVVKAGACASVERLHIAGLPLGQAYLKVGKLLCDLHFDLRGSPRSTPAKIVKGWRDGLSRRTEPNQLLHTRDGLLAQMWYPKGTPVDEIWADLKLRLANLIRGCSPALK